MSPISSDVSRKMPSPARRVRTTGSTDCTRSSTQIRKSLMFIPSQSPGADLEARSGSGRRRASRRARQVSSRPGSAAREGPSTQLVTIRMPCLALSAQSSSPSNSSGRRHSGRISTPRAVASARTLRRVTLSIRSSSGAGTPSASPRHQANAEVEPSATKPSSERMTASSAPRSCASVRNRSMASRSGPLIRGSVRGSSPWCVASTADRRRSGASRRRKSS